jgi:hypothetical protein
MLVANAGTGTEVLEMSLEDISDDVRGYPVPAPTSFNPAPD